ncbi:MAG: Pvc16 family protein [Algibacter sp.]
MIAKALQFTRNSLNQFIKNKFGLSDDIVVVNKIIDQNGSVPLENQNKVVISLIHLDQETVKPFYNKQKMVQGGNYENKPLGERYNLYLLISPNFDDYNETLKFLNASVQFFQINGMLDASSFSDMPKGITRIEFEFEKGDSYLQMHNLWSALGAKYQPSAIYKMKLISITSDEVKGFNTAISTTVNLDQQ